MRALPLVVSLAALGASAFSLVLALGLSKDLRERPTAESALEARLARVEQELEARDRGASAPRTLAPLPSSRDEGALLGSEPAASSPATGPSSTPGRRAACAADIEKRLADLEKKLGAALESAIEDAPVPAAAAGAIPFLNSIDEAAKHLELSGSQRADFERTIGEAKREIDVIRKTADETGETWEKAEKETVSYQNGGITIDGSKLAAFREKVMPGRSESFGGAMRRVREEGFRRLKATLTPAQNEKFSKAATDALLPGGNDMFGMLSFAPGPAVFEGAGDK